MDATQASTRAAELIGDRAWSLLSEGDMADAIAEAATLDTEYRTPTEDGWVPTYDPYFAAGVLLNVLHGRQLAEPSLRKFTSEGATIEGRPADWSGAAEAMFARSPLARLAAAIRDAFAAPTLGVVTVDGHVTDTIPTSAAIEVTPWI